MCPIRIVSQLRGKAGCPKNPDKNPDKNPGQISGVSQLLTGNCVAGRTMKKAGKYPGPFMLANNLRRAISAIRPW
jgi:hypothetical protein